MSTEIADEKAVDDLIALGRRMEKTENPGPTLYRSYMTTYANIRTQHAKAFLPDADLATIAERYAISAAMVQLSFEFGDVGPSAMLLELRDWIIREAALAVAERSDDLAKVATMSTKH